MREPVARLAESGKLLVAVSLPAAEQSLHSFGVEARGAPMDIHGCPVVKHRRSAVVVPYALCDIRIRYRGECFGKSCTVLDGRVKLLIRQRGLYVLHNLGRSKRDPVVTELPLSLVIRTLGVVREVRIDGALAFERDQILGKPRRVVLQAMAKGVDIDQTELVGPILLRRVGSRFSHAVRLPSRALVLPQDDRLLNLPRALVLSGTTC